MRALLYHGRRRLSVGEVDTPAPGPGQVLVRVDSVGMCKSDIYGYSQLNQRRDEVLGPGEALIMGHEAVGHVEDLGPGVSGIELGQAVAVDPIEGCGECDQCRVGATNICPNRRVYGCIPAAPGGFAERMIAPAANLVPLSGARPLEWGAMVEPLTVGEHGVVLADVTAGERVVVLGGGIIGLGAAFAAARRGAAVTVSEPMAERRRLAAELGLEAVSPEELEAREGYEVALDCVARPETIAASVAATGRLGRVILVGIWADEVALPVSRVVENETTVRGSFAYLHEDFVRVAEWIESTDVDLSRLIELRVSFGGVIDAFERYADGSLDAVRTVFKPAVSERSD